MRNLVRLLSQGAASLRRDDCGFVLSAELVLVLTIGVLAMIVGIHAVAKSINAELIDVAQGFSNLNQSHFVHGFAYFCPRGGLNAATGGSAFIDGSDMCDCAGLVVTSGGVRGAGGGSAVVTSGPVTAGPATATAPATPCPAPCGDAAVPCTGDCPCGPNADCPPGTLPGPASEGAPPVEPKHESK